MVLREDKKMCLTQTCYECFLIVVHVAVVQHYKQTGWSIGREREGDPFVCGITVIRVSRFAFSH